MFQIIYFALHILGTTAFTVDIVNITECRGSPLEFGDFNMNIDEGIHVDPLLSGTFSLPDSLDETTVVHYRSEAYIDDEWFFLFNGSRSVCNSIVGSLNYKRFRTAVQPNFPEACDIPEGDYSLSSFPVSGQYVFLSDIRNTARLTRHEVRLIEDGVLIICRIVYTMSNIYNLKFA